MLIIQKENSMKILEINFIEPRADDKTILENYENNFDELINIGYKTTKIKEYIINENSTEKNKFE